MVLKETQTFRVYTRNVCVSFKTIFDTFLYLFLYQSNSKTFSSVTHHQGTFLSPFIIGKYLAKMFLKLNLTRGLEFDDVKETGGQL